MLAGTVRDERGRGRHVGWRALDARGLDRVCRSLQGHHLAALGERTGVVFGRAEGRGARSSLFIHSASPIRRNLECDLETAGPPSVPAEVSAYVDARSSSRARPGDMTGAVGALFGWERQLADDGLVEREDDRCRGT